MKTYTIIFLKYRKKIFFRSTEIKSTKSKVYEQFVRHYIPKKKLHYPAAFALSSPSNDPKHKEHWAWENLTMIQMEI